MQWVRACGVAGLLLALSMPAQAQVSEGFAALEAADFAAATAAFQGELESPEANWGSLVEAHRHLVMLRFMDGDRSAAQEHLLIVLALDGDAAPPAAAGSQVAALFEQVRAQRDRPRLELGARIVSPELPYGPASLEASVQGVPPGLDLTAELHCDLGSSDLELAAEPVREGTHELRLELPAESFRAARCELRLRTVAGATVMKRSAAFLPAVSVEPEPPVLSEEEEESSSALGWVLGGVGLLAAVATVLAVVLLLPANGAEVGPVEIVDP